MNRSKFLDVFYKFFDSLQHFFISFAHKLCRSVIIFVCFFSVLTPISFELKSVPPCKRCSQFDFCPHMLFANFINFVTWKQSPFFSRSNIKSIKKLTNCLTLFSIMLLRLRLWEWRIPIQAMTSGPHIPRSQSWVVEKVIPKIFIL